MKQSSHVFGKIVSLVLIVIMVLSIVGTTAYQAYASETESSEISSSETEQITNTSQGSEEQNPGTGLSKESSEMSGKEDQIESLSLEDGNTEDQDSEAQNTDESKGGIETQDVTVNPTKVQNLRTTSVSTNAVKLAWTGDSNASGYLIERAEVTNGSTGSYQKCKTVKKTEAKDTGLSSGHIYAYRVTAYAIQDDGNKIYSASAVTETLTKPLAVSGFQKTDKSVSSVKMSWTASTDADTYIIERAAEKTDGSLGSFKEITRLKRTKTTYKDSGLTQAKRYRYRIYALKTDTTSTGEKITQVSSGTAFSVITKPTAVKNFKIIKRSTTAVKMSWGKNSRATCYVIYRAAEKSGGGYGSYKKIATLGTSKTTYTDKNLSSGRVYKYKIYARRIQNVMGGTSAAVVRKTITVPKAPQSVTVSSVTSSSVSLKWSKSSWAKKYEVYRNGKKIKTIAGTSFTDTGLSQYTKYKYSIKAIRTFKGKIQRSAARSKSATTNVYVPTYAKGLKGTWVEVSITSQKMKMYVNSQLYVTTDVVTGNEGVLSTDRGFHTVLSKASPARLTGSYNGSSWDVTVSYWLGFTYGGQGIHDSTWRSYYGGTIYKWDGSHGCVNTPLWAMQMIYSRAYVGMPVVIY